MRLPHEGHASPKKGAFRVHNSNICPEIPIRGVFLWKSALYTPVVMRMAQNTARSTNATAKSVSKNDHIGDEKKGNLVVSVNEAPP